MKRSARIEIKVAAGASTNAVIGWMGDVLKVAVTAPPERGKANRAVCALLAAHLETAPAKLSVARGASGTRKCITVAELSQEAVNARLRRVVP